MKKQMTTCRFCGKPFQNSYFVELLVKNAICKECFSTGVRKYPKKIGIEIINALDENIVEEFNKPDKKQFTL